MGLVLILLVFGLFVTAAYWIAWWMLEPINLAGGRLRLATQFRLTDVLSLMALLQVPLALVGRAIDPNRGPESDNSAYWLLLFVALGLVFVLWGAAVSVVSRAGITRLMPRMVVIVVLVPGTLAVIMTWPLSLIGFFGGLPLVVEDARLLVLSTVGMGALVAMMFGVRRLAFWSLVG